MDFNAEGFFDLLEQVFCGDSLAFGQTQDGMTLGGADTGFGNLLRMERLNWLPNRLRTQIRNFRNSSFRF